jgi:hypothetical protein
MGLLVSYESWSLTYNNVRIANGGEYSEMSDEYVEHLNTFFEEFYGEKVYIDEEEETNEFAIIRN